MLTHRGSSADSAPPMPYPGVPVNELSFDGRTAHASSDPEGRIAQALEARRAASPPVEAAAHWLLDSPGMAGVVATAQRLAILPGVPILVEGERGTGMKELGRLIHEADPIARTGRLLTMTASLIGPAEMRGRPVTGTLIIEDVENLPPLAQGWVAELLARRTVSAETLRIIAGSRNSARELQEHEGLDQELVHALDVGRIVIPPLRDRPDDILLLARRFLQHYAAWANRPTLRFSRPAERKLQTYSYPANARELRNLVERAVALAPTDEITDDAIVVFESGGSSKLFRRRISGGDRDRKRLPTLAEMERDYLVTLIRELGGHRTAISRTMGVSYPTVLRKIARYGLDVRAIVDAGRTAANALG